MWPFWPPPPPPPPLSGPPPKKPMLFFPRSRGPTQKYLPGTEFRTKISATSACPVSNTETGPIILNACPASRYLASSPSMIPLGSIERPSIRSILVYSIVYHPKISQRTITRSIGIQKCRTGENLLRDKFL